MKIEVIFEKIEELLNSKPEENTEDKKRELKRALVVKLANVEKKIKSASSKEELKKLEKKKKAIKKMYKKVH